MGNGGTRRAVQRMNFIQLLQENIKKLHRCDSKHLKTESVTETVKGKKVWEGDVEVFELIDHPRAKWCYAWSHSPGPDGKNRRYVAILAIPPVNSALSAVQKAIEEDFRKN